MVKDAVVVGVPRTEKNTVDDSEAEKRASRHGGDDELRGRIIEEARASWATRQEKALRVLHILRIRELTEYDPRTHEFVDTRFCFFNTAFFDLDQESSAELGPPFDEGKSPYGLDDWINIVSLRVLESDLGFPISVFGTVVVRDQVDFTCVYVFRRDRDHCQLITSPEDTLTLTGPYRGLAYTDHLFFEINLKVRGGNGVQDAAAADRDFSKGVVMHCNSICYGQPVTGTLSSWLSTLELVYTTVELAVVAAIEVDEFIGSVTAWTARDPDSRIVLYDSGAPGTVTAVGDDDGAVPLPRRVVAMEELVLRVCVCSGGKDLEGKQKQLFVVEKTLGHCDRGFPCEKGAHRLQVKVAWSGVLRNRSVGAHSWSANLAVRMIEIVSSTPTGNGFPWIDGILCSTAGAGGLLLQKIHILPGWFVGGNFCGAKPPVSCILQW